MSAFQVRIDRKVFASANGAAHAAVAGVSFEVGEGELVCLLGPSGAGKTTTLNIIAGLDTQFEGEVRFSDPAARDRLSYLFQNPRLLPWRTLLENVALPLKGSPDAIASARAWLDRVGLGGFHDIYPGQASVGMQRRAAIARGFAFRPSILLMDEPFVSLDEKAASELRSLLVELWRAERVSTLFVTHDVGEAAQIATRVLVYGAPPAKIVADIPMPQGSGSSGEAEQSLRRSLQEALSLS